VSDISGKPDAQRQADRVREFREYLSQLEKENILTLSPDQRQRVDDHLDRTLEALAIRFDVDITESQRQISLGMRIISALGGLALCIAVFLFFYRFWGLVTTPVQVTILIVTPLVALAATEFAALRERTLYFASLLAIVALASFVLNLTVLGTIFNITPSHKAFLPWGAFALILAYRYRLRIPLTAGLLCLLAFVSASVMTWQGCNWLTLGERPENFIMLGLILCAIPQIRSTPDFDAVYRSAGSLAVFIPLLALGESGSWTYLPLATKTVEHLYQSAGFLAAAFAIWFGITRRHREVLNLGAAFFAIFLISRFVAWWWDWMPKYLFFFLVGGIALALLTAFRKLRARVGAAA
jgi:uncharacterized membrane protein